MKIAKWDDHYENAQSRKVHHLSWVPVPNKHDGEKYSEIMTLSDAPIIFTAWILMLQVASRSQHRGSLLRDDGTPHTPESLALKTRGKAEWFSIAIPILVKIGWLDGVFGSNTSTLPEHSQNTPSTLPHFRDRTEGNRREQTYSSSSDDGFNEFWKAYPRKVGKGDAFKVWKKLSPNEDFRSEILSAVIAQSKWPDWIKDGGQFIPHPATWLNGCRWEDELPDKPKSTPGVGTGIFAPGGEMEIDWSKP